MVREWARAGALSLTYGSVGMGWALAAGPHDVTRAIIYCTGFTGLTAALTVVPSLRKAQEAPTLPADLDVRTNRHAEAVVLRDALMVAALLGLAGALAGDAMFLVGLLGLMTGALWTCAAMILRHQELHRLHGRVLAGERASRLRPGTARFYVTSAARSRPAG